MMGGFQDKQDERVQGRNKKRWRKNLKVKPGRGSCCPLMQLEIASIHRILLNRKHTQFPSPFLEEMLCIFPGIRVTMSTSSATYLLFSRVNHPALLELRGGGEGEENLLDILQMPDSSVFIVALWVGVIISEIRKPGLRKASRLIKDGAETVGRVEIGTQVHETLFPQQKNHFLN